MKLILFRHGLALDRDLSLARKLEDALRPLTEKGREKTKKMARHLRGQMGEVQMLVSSPLVRAQQTAHLIGEIIPFESYLECTELSPEAPPQAFANWLKSHARHSTSVLVVGHEPQLGIFASWALAGLNGSFLDLKKSGVLLLEIESFEDLGPACAELQWMLNPKLL